MENGDAEELKEQEWRSKTLLSIESRRWLHNLEMLLSSIIVTMACTCQCLCLHKTIYLLLKSEYDIIILVGGSQMVQG